MGFKESAATSWDESGSLTARTWRVLRARPYLFSFPVLGGLLGTVCFLACQVPLLLALTRGTGGGSDRDLVVYLVFLVVGIYAAVLMVQVFLGALVHCADRELRQQPATVGEGLAAAVPRLGAIAAWALIVTIVGWLLSLLRGGEGDNVVFAILRGILGAILSVAWTLMSMFVLPLIVLGRRGTIAAVRESIAIFRRRWGTQVFGTTRITVVVVLLIGLPAMLLMMLGAWAWNSGQHQVGAALLVVGGIGLLVEMVVGATLKAVFSVALYRFATGNEVIGPFTAAELESAVRVRS